MRKNLKKVSSNGKKLKDKLLILLSTVLLLGCQNTVASAATGKTDVLSNLKNAKSLYLGVIAVIGAIQAGRHISDFADAWSHRDGAEMKTSGMGIAAGLVMVFISGVLAFIGIS